MTDVERLAAENEALRREVAVLRAQVAKLIDALAARPRPAEFLAPPACPGHVAPYPPPPPVVIPPRPMRDHEIVCAWNAHAARARGTI